MMLNVMLSQAPTPSDTALQWDASNGAPPEWLLDETASQVWQVRSTQPEVATLAIPFRRRLMQPWCFGCSSILAMQMPQRASSSYR